MKTRVVCFILGIGCFFVGCEKATYEYLDANTFYKFKIGDTLIYKSALSCDSFQVSDAYKYMLNSDKVHNFESLNIEVLEINKNYISYCSGFSILRQGKDYTLIQFRNIINALSSLTSSNNLYKIGSYTLSGVYKIEYPSDESGSNRNIKIVYYTHKYGIIAYELMNGDKMELDEGILEK